MSSSEARRELDAETRRVKAYEQERARLHADVPWLRDDDPDELTATDGGTMHRRCV